MLPSSTPPAERRRIAATMRPQAVTPIKSAIQIKVIRLLILSLGRARSAGTAPESNLGDESSAKRVDDRPEGEHNFRKKGLDPARSSPKGEDRVTRTFTPLRAPAPQAETREDRSQPTPENRGPVVPRHRRPKSLEAVCGRLSCKFLQGIVSNYWLRVDEQGRRTCAGRAARSTMTAAVRETPHAPDLMAA